ncbi:MAG: hypothetical protein A4E23_01443 [Methanomethylovorans sp. PtaU1.Bin073]|nr:MAG: hypothetical protein A4E23_01443 [Methanomethylovorans sp. PtaU1.Bin073]
MTTKAVILHAIRAKCRNSPAHESKLGDKVHAIQNIVSMKEERSRIK